MCKYCEQDKSIFYDREGKEGGIREVVLERDGTLSVNSNNFDRKEADELQKWGFSGRQSANMTMYDVSIKINYCPMCGRQLVSESELISKTYSDGLNDAWELAKKIYYHNEMSRDLLLDVFGACNINTLFKRTPQELVEKLKAYEESKTIKVGDVLDMLEELE